MSKQTIIDYNVWNLNANGHYAKIKLHSFF